MRFFQKKPPEVFCRKDAPKDFANFTKKHLCWSLFLIKLKNFIKKKLQHRCFTANIAKFLRTTLNDF